jgi:hypothetical protein
LLGCNYGYYTAAEKLSYAKTTIANLKNSSQGIGDWKGYYQAERAEK